MNRSIIIAVPAPIPHGHRVEVTEHAEEGGGRAVLAVMDLETRIRYQNSPHDAGSHDADRRGWPVPAGASVWIGHVLECTVASGRSGAGTTLLIDPVGHGAAEVDSALRGADAAASAVTDEALRWGGTDRTPEPESPRFW